MKKENILTVLENVKTNGVTPGNYSALENLIADLESEIRKENNKRAGSASIEKSSKKYYQICEKK